VTSHDVVAQVRRERGVKVGHAGTLDPFATGLLLVLLGQATRAHRFLMGLPKTYRVVARLGWVSDTGDLTGSLTEGRMPSSLAIPVGEQLQAPPAFSAVKVGGERLYKKARRGEVVEAPPRPVTVHRADLLSSSDERAEFEIECSSGTYVRSLIADLGDAYCEELRRTAIGPFSVSDAGREVPLDDALAFLPSVDLSEDQAKVVGHGVAVSGQGGEAVRLLHQGRLLAIARGEGDQLKPFLVFN
jgi:tRNA pseudouridine55 synthase